MPDDFSTNALQNLHALQVILSHHPHFLVTPKLYSLNSAPTQLAMMRRLCARKRWTPQPFPIENLFHDLICLILEQVESAKELYNLCLVSRDMYLRVVPILYRNLDFRFWKASHRRLLARLGHPLSAVPRHIKRLSVDGLEYLNNAQLGNLHSVFLRLKNLRHLRYKGPLAIPIPVLDLIHRNYPGATIDVNASLGEQRNNITEADVSIPPRTILTHAAGTQMTRFTFTPHSAEHLYAGFKRDLLGMLRCNCGLTALELNFLSDYDFAFPEYVSLLRCAALPRLATFALKTLCHTFFTLRELELWGDKGGWEDLKTLELRDVSLFAAFSGRTPALEDMTLEVLTVQELDEIDARLQATGVADPLPRLRRVRYMCSVLVLVPAGLNRRLVPSILLKWMPSITALYLQHDDGIECAYMQSATYSPTAQEIQLARHLCPDLTEFGVDIVLQGSWAQWPMDVINELCQFEQPILLSLYIHRRNAWQAKFKDWLVDFFPIACHMRRQRERRGLPWTKPFGAWFCLVGNGSGGVGPDLRRTRSYDTWLGGFTMVYWYMVARREDDPDCLEDGELEDKKGKQFGGRFGWDWKDHRKKIERRKRMAGAFVSDGKYATLYDAWAQ